MAGFGVLAVIGGGWFWAAHTSRSARKLFRTRPELTMQEIFAEFYSDSSLASRDVESAFQEIGKVLGVPPGKLRPSDRFSGELAPRTGWEYDDGVSILSSRAERILAAQGRTGDSLKDIQTVDDYVRLVGAAKSST